MAERKTWVQKKTDWLENHPIWRWVILIALIMGLLGGIIGFGEKMVEFYQYITREDLTEIRIHVSVKNLRTQTVDINQICPFSVTEIQGNSSTTYYEFGDSLALLPTASQKGTNSFRMKAGESRDYFVRFPTNQRARDLIDKGAATLTIEILPLEGNSARGTIALEKQTIRKAKALVEIKP